MVKQRLQLLMAWSAVAMLAVTYLTGCGKMREEQLKAQSAAKEAWVMSNIKTGMTREEVIQKAGRPTMEDDNPKYEDGPANGRAIMFYNEGPPPRGVKEEWGYGGFEVVLKDGRVTDVSIIHRSVY